jgi:orotate phosphoribosyltransferase
MDELFESNKQRLLDLLRRKAYEKRPVVLASGRHSDFYIDCKRVVLTAEGHFLAGWLLNQYVARHCPNVLAVGGMSIGADPLVSAASFASSLGTRPLDAFYVRKEAKKHGTRQFIEGAGHLPAGTAVCIMEDVVTTGGSSLLAADRARQAGLKPVAIMALVDRCEGGREAIEQYSLPLVALYHRRDFE